MWAIKTFFILAAILALLAVWQGMRQKRRLAVRPPDEAAHPTRPQPGADEPSRKAALNIIELSNYAGSMALRLMAERKARYEKAVQEYGRALAQRQERINLLRNSLAANWRHKKPWRAFTAWRELRQAEAAPKPRPPVLEEPSKEEWRHLAGEAGERAFAGYLEARLDEAWTLIKGYKNLRGEIDAILVGPKGVFVFEIKSERGVFHTDGTRWWYDKYDNYGNVVEEAIPLADKGGRGPDRQLNESAAVLGKFLDSRGHKVRLIRAVIFSNNRAELGEMKNAAVDVVATLDDLDLDELFARSGDALEQATVERIIALIRKDHAWHRERDKAGSSSRRTGAATAAFATSP